MIKKCCPCFSRNSVIATSNQSRERESDIIVAQIAAGNTNLSDITEQMKLQSDEEVKRNEEQYAEQQLRENLLSQIKDAKHQGTLAQMQQITQFAETDKKNRSTQAILDQAKQAELEALKKRHQDALLPGDTQKKIPI